MIVSSAKLLKKISNTSLLNQRLHGYGVRDWRYEKEFLCFTVLQHWTGTAVPGKCTADVSEPFDHQAKQMPLRMPDDAITGEVFLESGLMIAARFERLYALFVDIQ